MIKKGSKLDSIEYIGNVPRAITWVVDHLETWVRSLSIANGLKKKARNSYKSNAFFVTRDISGATVQL